MPEGRTKSALTGKKLLVNPESFGFGAAFSNFKLNIICADDVFYNLEALRIIFARFGLLDNCNFVSNG